MTTRKKKRQCKTLEHSSLLSISVHFCSLSMLCHSKSLFKMKIKSKSTNRWEKKKTANSRQSYNNHTQNCSDCLLSNALIHPNDKHIQACSHKCLCASVSISASISVPVYVCVRVYSVNEEIEDNRIFTWKTFAWRFKIRL